LDIRTTEDFGNNPAVPVFVQDHAGFIVIGHAEDAQVFSFGLGYLGGLGRTHRRGFRTTEKPGKGKRHGGNEALNNHGLKNSSFRAVQGY
jgi:hypothetical protein